MYDNQQYENDLRFIAKIDNLISKKIEFLLYFVGLVSCMITHTIYMCLFYKFGIREMAIINVFSSLFYLASVIVVVFINEKIVVVYAGLIEVIAHASVATVFVGLRPDFGMFLLMIVPVLLLMPSKNKKIPFTIMFVAVSFYGILRYVYNDPGTSVYNWEHGIEGTIFYCINFAIGSFVLIYAVSIYTVMNNYTQSKIRVQNEQLKVLALMDPLTKLSNRRAMNYELKKIYDDSIDNETSYVIGIGDIDNFKKINDTYGHDYGDLVLIEVANIIKEQLPKHSQVARWGGEEFLFAIPKTDLDDGVKYAQAIVAKVGNKKFEKDDRAFSVTITFGISEGLPNQDVDNVINSADRRLYKGKSNGKNHTEYED